jgi:hypothetical protein
MKELIIFMLFFTILGCMSGNGPNTQSTIIEPEINNEPTTTIPDKNQSLALLGDSCDLAGRLCAKGLYCRIEAGFQAGICDQEQEIWINPCESIDLEECDKNPDCHLTYWRCSPIDGLSIEESCPGGTQGVICVSVYQTLGQGCDAETSCHPGLECIDGVCVG